METSECVKLVHDLRIGPDDEHVGLNLREAELLEASGLIERQALVVRFGVRALVSREEIEGYLGRDL